MCGTSFREMAVVIGAVAHPFVSWQTCAMHSLHEERLARIEELGLVEVGGNFYSTNFVTALPCVLHDCPK